MNDSTKSITEKSKPILFADDTSIIYIAILILKVLKQHKYLIESINVSKPLQSHWILIKSVSHNLQLKIVLK